MPLTSRLVALLLAFLTAMPPADAASPHKQGKQKIAAESSPLTEEQRVLHALNRLTFGPRPGDVQLVEKMGLQRWIDLQLNPAKIDDSALDARLSAYPAMRLSLHDLVQRFPSPAMIRAADRGRLPIPGNPIERAIYRNQIAQFRARQEKKAEQSPSNVVAKQGETAIPGTGTQPDQMAPDTMQPDSANEM
ncbi:MAG TPA: DUF1800 family protein, partial [Acidobacteriaceae bacterium]|nr:DUF1800 family protein [Acidobacteriaceae bacterium]